MRWDGHYIGDPWSEPLYLRYVGVRIIPMNECWRKNITQGGTDPGGKTTKMICAGFSEGLNTVPDSCTGDSG